MRFRAPKLAHSVSAPKSPGAPPQSMKVDRSPNQQPADADDKCEERCRGNAEEAVLHFVRVIRSRHDAIMYPARTSALKYEGQPACPNSLQRMSGLDRPMDGKS